MELASGLIRFELRYFDPINLSIIHYKLIYRFFVFLFFEQQKALLIITNPLKTREIDKLN